MSILSGFLKTKKRRLTEDGYKLQSNWTSSQTVVMGDGTDDTNTLEKNLGAIQGISSSLTSDSENIALSCAAGKYLSSKLPICLEGCVIPSGSTSYIIEDSHFVSSALLVVVLFTQDTEPIARKAKADYTWETDGALIITFEKAIESDVEIEGIVILKG